MSPRTSVALHTDLQQLSMLASYFRRGDHETRATCEMYVRRLPANRRFLVAAGLGPLLDALVAWRFTDAQLDTLSEIPELRRALTHGFVEYLRALRFTGNIHALPEGTVFFENEPLVRVEATLAEATLIETLLLSTLNFQTQVASKAARIVLASQGRPVVELGARRTHPEAAVDLARAAYIAGFDGTTNTEAFFRYEVPVKSGMSHMYIMASSSEGTAFGDFAQLFARGTYLVDTYDTLKGVARALDAAGDRLTAVRIDSGDLASLSREVRALLLSRGRDDVKIFLSSDLDEYEITRLVDDGDFDMAGVGTRLAVSDDAPSLTGVYKLVQIGDRPVAKFSTSKVTYPGAHQIYRHEKDGVFTFDHVGLAREGGYEFVDARPLLVPVMVEGRVLHEESLADMRTRAARELSSLPPALREIGVRGQASDSRYEVRPSPRLLAALEDAREQVDVSGEGAPVGDS
jgi:nicotinate phosphoribosyltransferase